MGPAARLRHWIRGSLRGLSGGRVLDARPLAAAEILRMIDGAERGLRSEAERVYPAAIDVRRGGFHQTFDARWRRLPDSECHLVAQARHVWTAAALAEHWPDRREEYGRCVRHGIGFLAGPMTDREAGGLFFTLRPDGRPASPQDDRKHAYGLAFAIYAAAAAHRVTGDPVARRLAIDTFLWLDRHAHDAAHGGYRESLERDGTPVAPEVTAASPRGSRDRLGLPHGLKTANAHIHLLEALVELLRIDPPETPHLRRRVEEVFGLVAGRFATPPGSLVLHFTRDWRPSPGPGSFGHDVETAFLLEVAAEVLGTPDAMATAHEVGRSLVDHALDAGFDPVRGGFFESGPAPGEPIDTGKVWWAQAEGLHALARIHARSHDLDARYGVALRRLWDFVNRHAIDRRRGGWHWRTDVSGRRVGPTVKLGAWKCAYHTTRSLIGLQRALRDPA